MVRPAFEEDDMTFALKLLLKALGARVDEGAISECRSATVRHFWAFVILFASPIAGMAQTNNPAFSVHSYGGKCLDFGAPPQVTGGLVLTLFT
jgi:hypothetical protein